MATFVCPHLWLAPPAERFVPGLCTSLISPGPWLEIERSCFVALDVLRGGLQLQLATCTVRPYVQYGLTI
jgi:hypothetical protein